MKPSFSIGDALSAPFGVLRRRPLTVLAWGVLMAAAVVALYALMIPLFANLPIGADKSEEAFAEYMLISQRVSPVMNGLTALMYLVVLLNWTAAGRATLSPDRADRFAFWRLGMDEVRVAVVVVAVFAGWYVGTIVLVLLGVGLGAALLGVDRNLATAIVVVYAVAAIIASIWLYLRVSLVGPASLILKDFAFVQGWRITRGQVWKLLGLRLLGYLVYIVSMVVVYALIAAVLIGGFFAQGLQWPSDVQTFRDLEPVARAMLAPGLIALIPLALGMGWAILLLAGPSVRAARHLLDGVPAPPANLRSDVEPANALDPAS